MHNLWLVAKHEYKKRAGKRSFLLGTLAIPLLMVVIMGFGILTAIMGSRREPLGYVDRAGIMQTQTSIPATRTEVGVIPFFDLASAQAALEQGEIQAFYLIPEDYLQSGSLTLYYWEDQPSGEQLNGFYDLLRFNLTADLPPENRHRLLEGTNLIIRSSDGSREVSSENFVEFLLPFFSGFLFIFGVLTSAGYMLQVVGDEKENRTIEIMMTSLTPEQLIGGKALGLISVALTQIFIWVFTATVLLAVAGQFVDVLRDIQIPWRLLLIVLVYFLPSFALIGGIMTAIGGAVTETRHGQQIGGILNMLFIVPYFLTAMAFTNPDSPLMIALTLFPTTAFTTITLRWGFTIIPAWQFVVSWVLLVLSAIASVYFSARIFRAGMLMYGQGLNLKAALHAIRGR